MSKSNGKMPRGRTAAAKAPSVTIDPDSADVIQHVVMSVGSLLEAATDLLGVLSSTVEQAPSAADADGAAEFLADAVTRIGRAEKVVKGKLTARVKKLQRDARLAAKAAS